MKKLRVGVIGLGMGRGHVMGFQRHPQAEVVALADLNPERLARVGDEFKVPGRYTDALEMLKKEKLDIVSVATPNCLHKPLTLAALEAGCHVLCEKPMAMNTAEADDMLAAAKTAGKRLMINFSFRFNPMSQALKSEVDSGALGDIYFGRTIWLRRRGMPGFGGWFGQKNLSGGGPLIDLGVHRLDLALWLMNYPTPVWVMGSTYDPIAAEEAKRQGKAFDCEDFAVGLIKFANGATLEVEASWAAHIQERELIETRLLGTKGGLLQRNLAEGFTFEAGFFSTRNGVLYNLKPHEPMPACPSSMEHLVDAIIRDEPHIASGEEGRTVMQLLDALYESARLNQPIPIGARHG